MDNQHKLIKGYNDLNQSELDAINSIKLAEQDIGQLWQQIRAMPGVDQRALALAKTGLQEAFHWFVRAVAKPLDVYELVIEPVEDTFLTRMKAELSEVLDKITKGTAFTNSPGFKKIPVEEQEDLVEQVEHMIRYSQVLTRRIQRNSQ